MHCDLDHTKSDFFFDSIGGLDRAASQAGVTVYPVHGKLLARDEVGPSFEIDPETLETLGTVPLPPGHDGVGFKAHSKMDPVTGEWIIAGSEFGRVMKIHAAVYEPSLKLKTQIAFESPRMVYIHDFMVTRTHIVFVLHPCEFSPWGFLAGFSSFKDSLTWRGEAGSVVAVVSRFGGAPTISCARQLHGTRSTRSTTAPGSSRISSATTCRTISSARTRCSRR